MTEMIPVPYINLPLVPGMSRPKTCSNASLVFPFIDFTLLWDTVHAAVTCLSGMMPAKCGTREGECILVAMLRQVVLTPGCELQQCAGMKECYVQQMCPRRM